MVILEKGAERGDRVNALEGELLKTKELLNTTQREAKHLSAENLELKETTEKLESGRNYDQINLQSSRDEVSNLESQIAKLKKMCDAKDVELNKKEETIRLLQQDARDLAIQKNAIQM